MAQQSTTAPSANSTVEVKTKPVTEGKPKKSKKGKGSPKPRRARREKPMPSTPFREVTALGEAIVIHGGGSKVRRLTIFEKLNRSPTSGPTRELITNSAKYGITVGSYAAEFLELTPEGAKACDPSTSAREKRRAEFALAIESIPIFKTLFTQNVTKRLPAKEVLRDQVEAAGVEEADRQQCVDIFVVNCNELGLLRTIGGAETLVSIDQVLESMPTSAATTAASSNGVAPRVAATKGDVQKEAIKLDTVCFYISPIGDDNSEARHHSDLLLNAVVRPAVEPLGLTVVRADAIGQAGMITSQTLEYIRHCKLAIADLSMLNPNVFYEIALRHACRQPIVHMIRKADKPPFDVGQFRAVIIDMASIYTLVPKLETYKTELAQHAKSAIDDPSSSSNPITVFYPDFWK